MSSEFYRETKNIIANNKKLVLSTNVKGNSIVNELKYIHQSFDLYFYLNNSIPMAKHFEYNPYTEMIIGFSDTSTGIIYSGRVIKVTDREELVKIAKKYSKKFGKHVTYSKNFALYKVVPLEIRPKIETNKNKNDFLNFPNYQESLGKKTTRSIKNSIKLWINITRAPFFTASLAPLLLGTAIAWNTHNVFNLQVFLYALIGVLFAHAGINMLNDYSDHKTGNDEANLHHNQFSGGSRIIQNKLLTPEKILKFSYLFIFISALLGLKINSLIDGNFLLIIGIGGMLTGILYSALPFKLAYHRIGELLVFLGFGFFITLGSYFVQIQEIELFPVLASIPTAILIWLIIYINEFQDFKADKESGKKTLVVLINNKKTAIRIYQIMVILPFVIIPILIFLTNLTAYSLLFFLILPMAIIAIRKSNIFYEKIYELLPVNQLTIGMHFLGTILLVLAFVLDKIF